MHPSFARVGFLLIVALVALALVDATTRAAPSGPTGTIDSFAGGGLGDGGPANQASFGDSKLVFGQDGDIYVPGNCLLRRIHAGVITTIAGHKRADYEPNDLCLPLNYAVGESATAADLVTRDVAVDADGAAYLDTGTSILVIRDGVIEAEVEGSHPRVDATGALHVKRECAIYRIDGAGAATLVAGSPATCGYAGDGGAATSALIDPRDIAFDRVGSLHIVQRCAVRIVSAGIITTVAGGDVSGLYCPDFPGDGSATAGPIAANAIAFDEENRLLVNGYCRIRRVENGQITTIAGVTGSVANTDCDESGDGGPALEATLNIGWLAADQQGRIFLRGVCARVIENGIIDRAGIGCGVGDGVHRRSASTTSMSDVAVDAQDRVYLTSRCRVRVIEDDVIRTIAGNGRCESSPDGIALESSMDPKAVAIGADGALYIGDGCRVRRILGESVTTVAGIGEEPATGNCVTGPSDGPALAVRIDPYDIVVDDLGDLIVSDRANCRIVRIAAGSVTTLAGNGPALDGVLHTMSGCGHTGSAGDGSDPLQAHMGPAGIALGPDGALYIADVLNCSIRRLDNGAISTVAGGFVRETGLPPRIPAIECDPDGFVESGPFASTSIAPRWLVFDADGSLFVGQRASRRSFGQCNILKIADGTITTVGGRDNYDGCRTNTDYDDGLPAVDVEFDIEGLAIDSAGNLYFGDNRHHRLRIVYGAAAPDPVATPTATVSAVAHSPTPNGTTAAVAATATPMQAEPTFSPTEVVAAVSTSGESEATGFQSTVAGSSTAPVTLPSTGTGPTYGGRPWMSLLLVIGLATALSRLVRTALRSP